MKTVLKISLKDEGWVENVVGLLVNYKFGFGRFNVVKMVSEVVNWMLVGE